MSFWRCEWARVVFSSVRQVLSRRDVLFSIAMMVAIYGAWPAFEEAFTEPDFSRHWQQDCDLVLIHKGLVEHPRFRDTLEWWTGTWVGQVPFWRPLTSLLFWLEWKAFGWEFQDAWMLVHGLSHVVASALLFLAAEALTDSIPIAALSVWLFCGPAVRGPLGLMLFTPGAPQAIHWWKDSPDVWLGIAVTATVIAALRGRWAVAAVFGVIAPLLKETGFALIPTLLVVFALMRRVVPIWWWIMPPVLLLMGATKIVNVGPGYIMGTNAHWTRRAIQAIGGLPVSLSLTMPAVLLMGLALALPFVFRRTRIAVLASTALLIMAASLKAATDSTGLALAVVSLIERLPLALAFRAAIWIVIAAAAIKFAPRQALVAVVLFIGLALPATAAPQVRSHAYYTAYMFEGILKAIGAGASLSWVRFALR